MPGPNMAPDFDEANDIEATQITLRDACWITCQITCFVSRRLSIVRPQKTALSGGWKPTRYAGLLGGVQSCSLSWVSPRR